MTPRPAGSDGSVAALPLAALLTLLVARWLPIQFEYRPNDLGIVSATTLAHYPLQQETFWALFGLAVGGVSAWLIGRTLARVVLTPQRIIGLEALAVCAFLPALWLPPVFAGITSLLACTGIFALVRGEPVRSVEGVAPQPFAVPARTSRWLATAWVLAILVAAALLNPGLWVHLWNVAQGVPDAAVTFDNFKFLGETGQHLAWANALKHGWFQGRDVFCLYGPLFDLGLVGFWSLVDRSAAAWDLYWGLGRVAGLVALLLLAGSLVRHRAVVLAIPFLLPYVELRVGWALFAACCFFRWLNGERRGWLVATGALIGVSLLYSQEYGAAISAGVAVAFALRRDWRGPLWLGVGVAAVATPLFGYYAAHDALIPMLRDVVQYPAYMLAGYGKLPFVGILENLPLDWSSLGSRSSENLRLSYAIPAVCLGGLVLALPMASIDPRHPFESLRRVSDALARDPVRLLWVVIAIFGIVSFRSAMGRASLHRTHVVLPAATLLLTVALDRTVALFRASPELRRLAYWRLILLVLLAALGGFLQSAAPLTSVGESFTAGSHLVRHGSRPAGSQHVMRVTRWVQLNTEPNEPVLFLPNDGAYYYLTDRPNPIRFVMGHQIVSEAHRAEVLNDLRRQPPRYIVWDHNALRVDDIPDELVFGRAILEFIEESYSAERRIGAVEILRHRSLAEPTLISEW